MAGPNDGGEAVLEALRNLGVDYIISSPGSEWPPVWEALARQQANETPGPRYINCWHETLAVTIAMGYTRATGRMQAVLLHAGVGLLQGAMGIHGAYISEVPMLVCSGESITYGEDPNFDPGAQWYRGLSVVGGPDRWAQPYVKWSSHVPSPFALYESVTRAGEMAQRVPKGPTFLDIPIEVMTAEWTPKARMGKVAPAPKTEPSPSDVEKVADLLRNSANPVIVTERAGGDPEAYQNLIALAETWAIPVVEAPGPIYANFPKQHPLHLGYSLEPFMDQSDLFLIVGSQAPWYPPGNAPANAQVVVVDEHPIKEHLVYQDLHADIYLEGDPAASLRLLTEAVAARVDAPERMKRWDRWQQEHNRQQEARRDAESHAEGRNPIDPVTLSAAISDVLGHEAVFVEETITHRPTILKHVAWTQPQQYFHTTGGLGQGLGLALGVKLAMPEKPVVALMGDGSFLYNPVVQSLGVANEAGLPILIVVFNNGKYSAMQQTHQAWYPGGAADANRVFHGVDIPGPDYSGLVRPFGGFGVRVEDPAELKPALANALDAVKGGQTAIVDVVLSV